MTRATGFEFRQRFWFIGRRLAEEKRPATP